MKFVGLPLAVHEPVQVLALGAAAEAESADPLVLSVDVQVELAAAEVFAAREASVVLEAFCVPEVFAVPEASAALEPFVVPAAVAKVALAAVGVGGVPVVLSAAAAPVAIARCIEPAASTADLEMAAGPWMWRVADVQQLVAEVDAAAAAHIAELLAELHEPERRAEQIVEPRSSPLKDPESCWWAAGLVRTLLSVAVLGLSLKMTYY